MNSPENFSPEELQRKAAEASEAVADAVHTARQKIESAGTAAVHTAREKIESASSTVVHWVRENPATALATVFASGVAVGLAFALGRHSKPTFGERLSDDPLETLREAIYSALAPLGERIHDAAGSARSTAGKIADSIHNHTRSKDSWTDRLRDAGDNLKFW